MASHGITWHRRYAFNVGAGADAEDDAAAERAAADCDRDGDLVRAAEDIATFIAEARAHDS